MPIIFLNKNQLEFKMAQDMYVIVGYPITDIGKGWVTGSVASQFDSSLMIKIDPMLNKSQPDLASYNLEGKVVNSDLKTYENLRLHVCEECNIHGG